MIYKIELIYRNGLKRLKGYFFKIYLQLHGCEVGKGLKCYTFPNLKIVPHKNIRIGNRVTFGIGCTLDISIQGSLSIEDDVQLTQNVLISSASKVSIGKFSAIGENSSIRDSDHGMKAGNNTMQQRMESKAVFIGEDVWVGASCIILKGSYLSSHSVIGANSLVNENSVIKENGIYVGSPVRCIKERI